MIENHPLRILTVGDGNFSFSLAYYKHLAAQNASISFIASSYDSFHELVKKYPESSSICIKLQQLGAIVLHRVNAITLEASMRNASSCNRSYYEKVTNAGVLIPLDIIIFHHPHLGHENQRKHGRLLSHFFHSSREILHAEHGKIHVTFTLTQLVQWNVQERAKWAGFSLRYCGHFSDYYRIQYDRKRHQNGKSFENVLMYGQQRQQASVLCIWSVANGQNAASIEEFLAKYQQEEPMHQRHFQCMECEKSFRTAQGRQTHFHMMHVLGVSNSASESVNCDLCDRSFKSRDALGEHQVAKHGENPLVLPDWMHGEPSISSQREDWECSICRDSFGTKELLDAHLEDLSPTEGQRQVCELCHAKFQQVRALRQHENHCRLKRISNCSPQMQAAAMPVGRNLEVQTQKKGENQV